MTDQELNTKLYEKMSAEQQEYRQWLLSQQPEEILNHCFEYSVREDIILSLESLELSPKQCRALLKSPTPLADVLKEFLKGETAHMDEIQDAIKCRADEIIKADRAKNQTR